MESLSLPRNELDRRQSENKPAFKITFSSLVGLEAVQFTPTRKNTENALRTIISSPSELFDFFLFIVCVFVFLFFFWGGGVGRRVASKAQPRCVFMALIKSNNGAGAQQSALRTLAF